jgi:hypothetical protein
MSKVIVDTGVSLDGFVVGPNIGPHNALGDGGTLIHQWLFSLETWRERQSLADGETNPDDEVVKEAYARVGAYMMGRRMFDEGEVNWPDPRPSTRRSSPSRNARGNRGSGRVARPSPSSPTSRWIDHARNH